MDSAVPPVAVLAGQPEDQGPDGRPVVPRSGPGGPSAAGDAAMPAQDRVRGDQQMLLMAAGFRDQGEQRRQERPVRPFQFRAARLLPRQEGELVAQDNDLRGLPCLLTPG